MLPTFWPEVTRGSERLVHDLGVRLVERGHDVTVLTTHRKLPSRNLEDGMTIRRRWRPPEAGPLGWYEHHIATIPGAVAALRRGRFDLAHACFLSDAWAASRARRLGGPPFVYSIHGIPTRSFLVARRRRLEMIERVLATSRWTSALSAAAADPLHRYLGYTAKVLPGGVETGVFKPSAERAREPTVVCTANLGDPRKGAAVLFEAFAHVRREIPAARLRLVVGHDPVMGSAATPELPDGAEWVVAADAEALAREYSAAWVSALPSVHEAFGLVVIESLACDTPVLVARSGALPELVGDDPGLGIGWIAEPGSPGELAMAMAEALQRPPDPQATGARRSRAAEFAWPRVADAYEAAYAEALGS